jgi:hypothetical protein
MGGGLHILFSILFVNQVRVEHLCVDLDCEIVSDGTTIETMGKALHFFNLPSLPACLHEG